MDTLLRQTPAWVWAVLAGLLLYGGSQLRERQLTRPRILIVPLVMTTLSLSSVAQAFGASAAAQGAWAAGAAVGLLLNGLLLRQPAGLRFDAARGRLTVPGSPVPLLLMLLIFAIKYVVTASLATGWQSPVDAGFALPASAALGLCAGGFVSRAAVMWRACR